MSESSPDLPAADAVDTTLATRVAYLSRPDSYPERPSTVEAIETRLSWVFLTPERAWKLKKPVSYDHLDFSSIEARRRDCEAEVHLNRPLAPDIYLGVEALTGRPHGLLEIGGDGAPVDYLVCMRRLPSARCLENQIRSGEPDAREVGRAAEVLTDFYVGAPKVGAVDPDALAEEVDMHARELEGLALGPDAGVGALRDRLAEAIAAQRACLARRQRREVHGDLRPQHVYPGEPPVFLDRLTFRRDLRLMDPAEELAFLALDTERLGSAWVGEVFVDAYRRATGDTVPTAVFACYRARRALLWALLSGRHLLRGGPERHWRERTREYLALGLASLSTGAD